MSPVREIEVRYRYQLFFSLNRHKAVTSHKQVITSLHTVDLMSTCTCSRQIAHLLDSLHLVLCCNETELTVSAEAGTNDSWLHLPLRLWIQILDLEFVLQQQQLRIQFRTSLRNCRPLLHLRELPFEPVIAIFTTKSGMQGTCRLVSCDSASRAKCRICHHERQM